MCINWIIICDMDLTPDKIYLKGKTNFKTYYFSIFDKFTVLQSLVAVLASVLFLLILFFLPLNSARGHGFLSKPLFRDWLVVLYRPLKLLESCEQSLQI